MRPGTRHDTNNVRQDRRRTTRRQPNGAVTFAGGVTPLGVEAEGETNVWGSVAQG